ncbi:MAG: reductase [Acidobacteria bacterium]|nr:reductase [Acidobacteriota bacterium]
MKDVSRTGYRLTRRGFLQWNAAAAAALSFEGPAYSGNLTDPRLQEAIAKLEYLTAPERVFILDKGKTGVVDLPPEKHPEIGLVPETWSLDVVPDPASNSIVDQPLSKAAGNALNWDRLMNLAEKHAIDSRDCGIMSAESITRATTKRACLLFRVPFPSDWSWNARPGKCR